MIDCAQHVGCRKEIERSHASGSLHTRTVAHFACHFAFCIQTLKQPSTPLTAVKNDISRILPRVPVRNYGPLENELQIHSDLPHSPLGPQEVRIKVRSAAVNPVDYALAEGMGKMFLGKEPSPEVPFTIGFDASGEVVEVGNNTKRIKVGDAVYAATPISAFGTLTEYLVQDEEFVALKPNNLDFNEAAAVPSVALTGYAGMVAFAKLQKGETALILGGRTTL